MNRLSSYLMAFAAVMALCPPAPAQNTTKLTVSAEPRGSKFLVDGAEYVDAVTFQWQIGSKHTLQWLGNQVDGTQIDQSGYYRYTFKGWQESTGLLLPSSYANQTVIADPSIQWYKANVDVEFLVQFRMIFFGRPLPSDVNAQPNCAAPGDPPPGSTRPGIVYFGGTCSWSDFSAWSKPGTITLNAIPFPGFLFQGWDVAANPPNAWLSTYDIKGPITIFAYWAYGKRTKFQTSPPGLSLTIDNQSIPTPPVLPCDSRHYLPPDVNFTSGNAPVSACIGEFDYTLDSKHVLDAPAPQRDGAGNLLALDSWSISGGTGTIQGNVYTASSIQWITPDVITAKFGPAVSATVITQPTQVKVAVDGKDNWTTNTFYWAQGHTHTFAAPTDAVDAGGRKYQFNSWSNGGTATQSVKLDKSMTLVATYDKLSRAVLQATKPNVVFTVDGADCPTPCTLDRLNGTTATVTPPANIPLSTVSRLEFAGWQDGGVAARTLSFDKDYQALGANYVVANKVTVVSDPAGAATVDFSPPSSDGFYRADSQVSLIASSKPGYKFLHWEGDFYSTDSVITINAKNPRIMRAIYAKVPFIAPAGVRNAASDTPVSGVAPGSLISIYGENLADHLEVGPSTPLAQTLAGTMVLMGDRLLPLIYVSPEQINAQLPADVDPGKYTLTVKTDGAPDISAEFTVVRNAPGLFINHVNTTDYVLAVHEDGSLITPDSPAKRSELVTVLGTGFGPYKQVALEGFAVPDSPVNPLVDTVEVTANATKLTTTSSVAAPGYVGITAVKFRLTKDLPSGTVDLKVTSNGQPSNTLPLPIE